MASKAQVETAILEREGFRVEFELFDGKRPALPPYEYPIMAPQQWKASDLKNARLAAYRFSLRASQSMGATGSRLLVVGTRYAERATRLDRALRPAD